MPAPDLATCLDYSAALDAAWKAILEAADAVVFGLFEKTDAATPRIEIGVDRGQTLTRYEEINGERIYCAWNATMLSRIVTHRSKNSDQQKPLLATVLNNMLGANFTAEVLPYHKVKMIKDAGMTRGKDEEGNDVTEQRHELLIEVIKASWPV